MRTVGGLFEDELSGRPIYKVFVDVQESGIQIVARGIDRVILRPGYQALRDRFLLVLQTQHAFGCRHFGPKVHVRESE